MNQHLVETSKLASTCIYDALGKSISDLFLVVQLILFIATLSTPASVHSQHTILYDYAIRSVGMFEIAPNSEEKTRVSDLGAYMYDIGPAPQFQFEVEIEQLQGRSKIAHYAQIHVEQYMLLRSKNTNAYRDIDSSYSEATFEEPEWTFHSPIKLSFDCEQENNRVICTSSSLSPEFMNPDNPLTYAAPHAYQVLGFAYRFVLLPSSIRVEDTNSENDVYQVTFMKR